MISEAGHTPDDLPPGLLEEYLKSVGAQLAILSGLADRLATAGDDVQALDALRREVHKVHGAAGSYGFWEASRLAAEMEEAAKRWLAQPHDQVAERGVNARRFVTRLAEALRTG